MTPLSPREIELVRAPDDDALWAAYSLEVRAAGESHAAEWLNLPGYDLHDPDSGFSLEWRHGFVVAAVVDIRPKLVKWPPLADQFGLLLSSPAARLLSRIELHRLEDGSRPAHYLVKLVERDRPALREAILWAEDAWRSFQDVTALRARLRALRWLAGFAPKWKDVPDHIARHELPRPAPASPELLARVERVWNEIEARFREPLPGPVSEETIDEAEREIGFRFPPDLRASYLRHGAESYPLLELVSLDGARRAWRESVGDMTPGTWRRGWFPITVFESDCRCADLDPTPSGTAGQIFYWSHEGPGPSKMERPSFVAWLEWAVSEDGFEVFDD